MTMVIKDYQHYGRCQALYRAWQDGVFSWAEAAKIGGCSSSTAKQNILQGKDSFEWVTVPAATVERVRRIYTHVFPE